MKKIMITAYDLEIGGIEKSLINLLKNISNKFEITLVLQHEKGSFLNDVPKNVKIINYNLSVNKNIIFRKITNRLKLIKFIANNKNKFDTTICFATYDYTSSIITRKLSKKSILWVHTNYLNLFSNNIEKFKSFFNKRKINKFNKIVLVSNEAKKDFVNVYPALKEKSIVINNLIDQEEIIAKSNLKKIKRPKSPLITYVGRLEEDSKGLLMLFDVAKELPAIEFWIIGDGPDKLRYENYISENKIFNAKLLDNKDNPYPYIKNTDLLILPSKYEGFPVVILEGLALNQRILSTITVSANSFDLKDYIYITKRNKTDLKNDILKYLNYNNPKKFNAEEFNKDNLELILQLLEGK